MQTIETNSEGVKRLTEHALTLIVGKHEHKVGFRERPVRNFLLSIDTNMRSGDCFANCDMDARLYNWKSPIVTAIHHGINHLFYGKKL